MMPESVAEWGLEQGRLTAVWTRTFMAAQQQLFRGLQQNVLARHAYCVLPNITLVRSDHSDDLFLSLQLPALEEIEAMLAGRKQTAIVFFLDETFEELEFDATSTVLEAVEYLAGVIKLHSYQTFTLYECRKVYITFISHSLNQ